MREEISERDLADAQIRMLQARVNTLTIALGGAITAMEAEQRVVHPSNRERRASFIDALREALERKTGDKDLLGEQQCRCKGCGAILLNPWDTRCGMCEEGGDA